MEPKLELNKIFYTVALVLSIASVGFLLYCIFINNTYSPTSEEMAKKFHFITASSVLTISTILLSLASGKKLKLRLNPTDWLVLTFALYLLLNTYVNQAPATTHISVLILLAALYFNIRVIVAADSRFPKYFIIMLLLAGIGQAYIGFRQLYGAGYSNHSLFPLTGSFYNPGPYAGFLAVVFSLAFYEMLNLYNSALTKLLEVTGFKEWIKAFSNLDTTIFSLSTLAAVAIFVLIPSTMSRTAWLAMTVCIAIILASKYGLLSKISDFFKNKRNIAVLSTVLVGSVTVLAVLYAYNIKRGSADGRLMMWKISSKVMLSRPLTGTGIGKFGAAYGEEQARYFAAAERTESEVTVAEGTTGAFNDYLQIGTTLGITGLVIFLLFVASAFPGYRNSSHKGLIYALIAMLVFATASYPLTLISFQAVFIVLIAIGAGNARWSFATMDIGYKTTTGIGLCLLAICVYCYATINRFEAQYKEWKTVSMIYNMQNYESAARGYQDLYPDLDEYPEFLFEYGRTMNQTGSYTASNNLLEKASKMICDPMIYNVMGNNYKALGDNISAEQCYKKAHSIVPNRIYPLYLLANLYFDTKQTEKAIQTADQLLGFKEKVTSKATQEIKRNIQKRIEEEKFMDNNH